MRLVGLAIAFVLAGIVFYLVLHTMSDKNQPQTALVQQTSTSDVTTTPILVAAKPIPIGEVVTADMLRPQDWPQHLVLDGFVTSGDKSKNLIGMVTRSSFQEGEPMLMTKLSNPEDPNFLAAGLAEGRKVATISVDNISSDAGFIFPGDRVDVLVTHTLPNPDADPADGTDNKEHVTETLLTNVKVLAVDDRATAGAPVDANQAKKPPTSVSLDVTLEDAQKLRLAQETGYVSLALRSLKDKDKQDTATPTKVGNLTMTSAYPDETAKKDKEPVRIIRGTQSEEVKSGTIQPGMAQPGMMPQGGVGGGAAGMTQATGSGVGNAGRMSSFGQTSGNTASGGQSVRVR